jgi:hypothetical protein
MKPNSIASFDEQNMDDISNEESMDMIDDYGDNMDEDDDDDDEEDDEDDDEIESNRSTNINNSIDSSLSKSSSSDNLRKLNNKINYNSKHKKRSPNGLITNGSSKMARKRKSRTTFSKMQLNILENEFLKSNFVSNDKIDLLIEMTGLDSRIIKVRLFFFDIHNSNLLQSV